MLNHVQVDLQKKLSFSIPKFTLTGGKGGAGARPGGGFGERKFSGGGAKYLKTNADR